MYLHGNTNVVEHSGTIQYMRNHVGKMIAEARAAKGWSQGELAAKAGVSQGTIGHLESGRNQSSTKLPQIAAALGMAVEELVSTGQKSSLTQQKTIHVSETSTTWVFGFDRARYDRLSAARKRKIELLVLGQISEWESEDMQGNRQAS